MAGSANPGYGTPNWEMLQRWFALDPGDDGPFWALNLMKYRPVAAYEDADTDAPVVSGKEADATLKRLKKFVEKKHSG